MKYFLDFGTHKFEGLEEFIPKLQIDKNTNVMCFEPNKEIYDASRKNTELLERYQNQFNLFHHYNLAVMNYTGEITFNNHKGAWNNVNKDKYIEGYTTGSNCIDINPQIDYGNGVVFDIETTTCKCIDIEEILSSIIKHDPDAKICIKCDIEGSEFVVLPKLITSPYAKSVDAIFIEWHERFWFNTIEYQNKIKERQQIISQLNSLGIRNYIHT
jgi:FkbM family methyltransferase